VLQCSSFLEPEVGFTLRSKFRIYSTYAVTNPKRCCKIQFLLIIPAAAILKSTHREKLRIKFNLLSTNKAYLWKSKFFRFGNFCYFLYCCRNKIKGMVGKLLSSAFRKPRKNWQTSTSVIRAPFQVQLSLAVLNCGSLSTKEAGDCIRKDVKSNSQVRVSELCGFASCRVVSIFRSNHVQTWRITAV
jgi:hypothetical protein